MNMGRDRCAVRIVYKCERGVRGLKKKGGGGEVLNDNQYDVYAKASFMSIELDVL